MAKELRVPQNLNQGKAPPPATSSLLSNMSKATVGLWGGKQLSSFPGK